MNRLTIFRVLILTVLLFPIAATAQIARAELISSKYLRVTPGVTTRSEVEKMFGRPADAGANRHVVDYLYETEFMTVSYSYGEDCNGAEWTVPDWVVEEVDYGPRDVIRDVILPLNSVILKVSAFKEQRSGHVTDHVKYVNEAAGISVYYDKTEKSVTSIIISPTIEQKKAFGCK